MPDAYHNIAWVFMKGDEHFVFREGIEGVGGVVHEGQPLVSRGRKVLQGLLSPPYHQPISVNHFYINKGCLVEQGLIS